MQSLDKNFRHLSRQQKLQQLVDKQWLSEDQFDILLNHPLIDEEVANSLIENVIAPLRCRWIVAEYHCGR